MCVCMHFVCVCMCMFAHTHIHSGAPFMSGTLRESYPVCIHTYTYMHISDSCIHIIFMHTHIHTVACPSCLEYPENHPPWRFSRAELLHSYIHTYTYIHIRFMHTHHIYTHTYTQQWRALHAWNTPRTTRHGASAAQSSSHSSMITIHRGSAQ